jgi:hypothetical protein
VQPPLYLRNSGHVLFAFWHLCLQQNSPVLASLVVAASLRPQQESRIAVRTGPFLMPKGGRHLVARIGVSPSDG